MGTNTIVVGSFQGLHQAIEAIRALRRAGFSDSQIGLLSRDDDAHKADPTHSHWEEGSAIGAAAGAVTGAGVGAAGDVVGEKYSEGDFDRYDNDFRTHYQSSASNTGYTYDQYTPVYRYGYGLANDPMYRDRDWSMIETDARTRWEERNPGTWEQFKDSVHYAWDKARGAR